MSEPFYKLFNGGSNSGRYPKGSKHTYGVSIPTGDKVREQLLKENKLETPYGTPNGKTISGITDVDYTKTPQDKLESGKAYHSAQERIAREEALKFAGQGNAPTMVAHRNKYHELEVHHGHQRRSIEDELDQRKSGIREALLKYHTPDDAKLVNALRESAIKWNGLLPASMHPTEKEISNARQLLPKPDIKKFKTGDTQEVTLPRGVCKGKKVCFTFKAGWKFNNNVNGKFAGEWIAPLPVEHKDFLKGKY